MTSSMHIVAAWYSIVASSLLDLELAVAAGSSVKV